jgi:hypothetical protein
MTLTIRRTATAVAAVVIASSALLSAGGAAHATAVPPWEPDPSSVGGLIFYNASGDVITGGSVSDTPIAAYVQGSATIRTGDTKATLYGYLPKDGQPIGAWSGEILGGPSTYGPTNPSPPPSPISGTLPLYTGVDSDNDLADLIAAYPNTDVSSDGYAGLYQLRLRTTAAQKPNNLTYDSADIQITGTGASATWSVVYSKTQVSTTTTLAVSPSGSAFHGATVKLTATETPAVAGSVSFFNGTKLLKKVAVSAGKATYSTKTLADGTYKLKATFTPTNTTAYAASTSTTHTLTVKAHSTSVKLKASASSVKKGKKLTLTATETPAVAGKVVFYDGSKKLGTVKVKKGKATLSTTKLAVGSHKLKATFTPTSTQNDAASTSKTVKVKVTK